MKTLKELIWKTKWNEVVKSLVRMFPDEEAYIIDFKNVYKELLSSVPNSNEKNITISIEKKAPKSKGEVPFYEISGLLEDADGDFAPFYREDWLSFLISDETLSSLTVEEIVTVCLVEMVWMVGFNQEEFAEAYGAIFNDELDSEMEKIEKMKTLKEVMSSLSWDEIESSLVTLFPNQKINIEQYQKLFYHLLSSAETGYPYHVVEIKVEEGLLRANAASWSLDENNQKEWYSFKANFMWWSDWLYYRVSDDLIEKYTKTDIIAVCLYEMTYYSFDEEEVNSIALEFADLPDKMIPWFMEKHKSHV